jgi:hypothetical protein
MVTNSVPVTVGPLTLRSAQELLRREWPGRDAPVSTWVAYQKRAAELYAQVARVDPGHQHEAMYWAGQAREALEALSGAEVTDGRG